MSESLHERIAYRTYASAEWLAVTLPERAGSALFRCGGRIAARTARGAHATVSANLSQVLGIPSDSQLVQASVRESFDMYARYWHETFRARVLSRDEIEERVSVEGFELLEADLEAGRGTIVASPHMGNWDVVARYATARGLPVVAVVEALKPKRLFDLFTRHREALGMKVVAVEEGVNVVAELTRHLQDNRLVALVADRDLSGKGIEVEMFGRARKLPTGPALLSLKTGAPLHPVALYADAGRWSFRVSPALSVGTSGRLREDVAALTGKLGAEFERAIAASPTDWHMFQPAWS